MNKNIHIISSHPIKQRLYNANIQFIFIYIVLDGPVNLAEVNAKIQFIFIYIVLDGPVNFAQPKIIATPIHVYMDHFDRITYCSSSSFV